jgi:hypothetical protein
MRSGQLNKMDENRTFMKEWEAEGKNNWKANMKRK